MKWWNLSRRIEKTTNNPCDDCTREFRKEMTAIGRCDLALEAAKAAEGQRKAVV